MIVIQLLFVSMAYRLEIGERGAEKETKKCPKESPLCPMLAIQFRPVKSVGMDHTSPSQRMKDECPHLASPAVESPLSSSDSDSLVGPPYSSPSSSLQQYTKSQKSACPLHLLVVRLLAWFTPH